MSKGFRMDTRVRIGDDIRIPGLRKETQEAIVFRIHRNHGREAQGFIKITHPIRKRSRELWLLYLNTPALIHS